MGNFAEAKEVAPEKKKGVIELLSKGGKGILAIHTDGKERRRYRAKGRPGVSGGRMVETQAVFNGRKETLSNSELGLCGEGEKMSGKLPVLNDVKAEVQEKKADECLQEKMRRLWKTSPKGGARIREDTTAYEVGGPYLPEKKRGGSTLEKGEKSRSQKEGVKRQCARIDNGKRKELSRRKPGGEGHGQVV